MPNWLKGPNFYTKFLLVQTVQFQGQSW